MVAPAGPRWRPRDKAAAVATAPHSKRRREAAAAKGGKAEGDGAESGRKDERTPAEAGGRGA